MDIFCSHCGKEIEERPVGLTINHINEETKGEDKRLCMKCTRKLLIWTDHEPPAKKQKKRRTNRADAVPDELIIKLRHSGLKWDEVAKRTNLSRSTVINRYYRCAEYKNYYKKEIDVGKVGALLRAGWSIDKIADEMQTSPRLIREVI